MLMIVIILMSVVICVWGTNSTLSKCTFDVRKTQCAQALPMHHNSESRPLPFVHEVVNKRVIESIHNLKLQTIKVHLG